MKMIFLTFCLGLTTMISAQSSSYSSKSYADHQSSLKNHQMDIGTMAYIDEGTGPVVVMVHGIPTSSWLYRKMISPLVEKGYRVIVPDMMGAGSSSKDISSDELSFEGQSKCLMSLLSSLNVTSCCLVVHDAGGPWSWPMLSMKGHPVNRVVLLNTILYEEGFNPPVRPKENKFLHRTLRWAYGVPWISKMIVKSTLKSGLTMSKLDKEEKQGYTEEGRVGKALAGKFFGSIRNVSETTTQAQSALNKQDIPLMAVWGQKDKILLPNKQLPLIMSQLSLPKEDAHILVGCNHFIQEEAPEEIVRYIDGWLTKTGNRH